jgi:hypothetical protein
MAPRGCMVISKGAIDNRPERLGSQLLRMAVRSSSAFLCASRCTRRRGTQWAAEVHGSDDRWVS